MMKALYGILLLFAMLLAEKLIGPAAENKMIYKDPEITGLSAIDPETALKMELLINGNTFIYRNYDTNARLNFRNGNFIFSCQTSKDELSESLRGSYFFAREDETGSHVLVLRRTKSDLRIDSQNRNLLSPAHLILSLNTLLKIEFNQKPFRIDSPVSSDSLILRGFHVFCPG